MTSSGAPAWRSFGWVCLPIVGIASILVGTWAGGPADAGTILVPAVPGAPVFPRIGAVPAWAGATIFLALAAGSNLVLRSISESHRGRRFFVLSACSAGSVLLVAAALTLGHLLGSTDDPGRYRLVAAGTTSAVSALVWTLCWGVPAAAITVWLNPPRPVAQLGSLLRARLGFALALVLAAGLAAGSLLVAVGAEATTRSDPEARPPASVATVPVPSSDPTDPALLTNPDPVPGFKGRCAADAVRMSYRTADAAAGRRFGLITATNTGAVTCVLKGYPDVAFTDVGGNNVRVQLEAGAWQLRSVPVRAIKLAPGESARAELTWRGDAGAADRAVDEILVAPWAGASRTVIAEPFDVKNGSSVTRSPWLPTK